MSEARSEGRHPAGATILAWFSYDHLPVRLQAVAAPVTQLAQLMYNMLPDGPELTVGLRKLLEAKDCLVRAELGRTGERIISPDSPPPVGAWVIYRLSQTDADMIENTRKAARAAGHRVNGNQPHEGDLCPAVVVRTFGGASTVANLQVLLDGDHAYWATSRMRGDAPGTWA